MIEPSLYLAFVTAVAVLMLIPGPNVALIVANSLAYGARYGLLTVLGTSAAMVVQLGLTAWGLSAVLGSLGVWFGVLRWIGVAYLVALGVRQWRAPVRDLAATSAEPKSTRAILGRAVVVSSTNPKTLFFYGAFFPQFLTARHPIGPQLAILAVTFVVLALVIDGIWAIAAGRARRLLAGRGRLRHRISGGALIGAGAALALTRRR